MIVETPLDFDWDEAMAKLATLPRQQEWEDYMSVFQKAAPRCVFGGKVATDGENVLPL